MKLIVSTNNMNCFLTLYQACDKRNIHCTKLENHLTTFNDSDLIIFLESNPFGFYENLTCNVVNKNYFDKDYTNKYKQYLCIKESGLNYIPTYTLDEIKKLDIDLFVEKPIKGSMGIGVELLHNKENFQENCIYQPFIRNNGDWRVIVINNKAVSMIMRKGFKFRNNLAQGAIGWQDWDDEAAYLAEKASMALDIEYAGIDIIKDIDTEKYYFLESNSTTTYDTSQILTKIDIGDILVEYINEKYNK